MSDYKFPYLCGGVLYLFLNDAQKANVSARSLIQGETSTHSAPQMMHDLICAISPHGVVANTGFLKSNGFKKEVSDFRNCKTNGSLNLPFNQVAFISTYDSLVRTEYTKAMNKMQKFLDSHLEENKYEWLVKVILDLIERDTDISDSDQFYIARDGMPKTKNEMLSMDTFHLSAFLVGVMHYILLYRKDNKSGLATLNKWSEKVPHKPRKYIGDSGVNLDRNITVIMGAVEEVAESGQSDELPVNVEEATECGQMDELGCPSTLDEKLYAYFKAVSEDVLVYIIEHDPLGGPTDCQLPYNIGVLLERWNRLVLKIEDRAIRETVHQTMEMLSEYRYYLSDVFLRYAENQNFLIIRNQSVEDARRNEEIMRPKTVELRCALCQQYQRMNNLPEIDYAFIDFITSVEESDEGAESAFR